MGVQGLWELLSPVGRPVTLESLENKTLAVDVSIWLNQAVKGCRDKDGQSPLNAHLMIVFHRICKLLFYKIKPIFVFDGHPPELKKQTLLERQKQREQASQKYQRLSHYVLKKYLMQQLKIAKDKQSSSVQYAVNNSQEEKQLECQNICNENDDSEFEVESYHHAIEKHFQNPFSINFETDEFKTLPLDIQHELLTEIKERYKRKCYLEQDEIPKNSGEFSNYQVSQLLNRRKIQQKLEDVQKSMSQRSIGYIKEMQLPYLDLDDDEVTEERCIMSEEHSHFILFKQSKVSTSGLSSGNSNEQLNNAESNEIVVVDDRNCETVSNPTNIEIVDLCSVQNDKETDILKIASETKEIIDESNNQHSIQLEEKTLTKNINNENIHDKSIEKSFPRTEDKLDIPIIIIQDSSNNETVAESQSKLFNLCENRQTVNNSFNNNCFTVSPSTKVDESDSNNKQNQDDCCKMEKTFTAITESKREKKLPTAITIDLNKSPIADDDLFPATMFEESFIKVDNMDNEKKEHLNASITNDLTPGSIVNNSLTELEQNEEWRMPIDFENLDKLEENLKLIQSEQQDQYRRTLTITEHMYQETKELLTLFGIPYVNSPTEAEAQCAQLELLSLTNGTITDDSDIWLFGGQKVYKNFFVQKKHVEFFKHTDIKLHFNMDRDKLIAFAMLTGSDYTRGIHGVGPVTAMEILSEFSGDGFESLQNFRKWWEGFQQHKELPKNSTLIKLQKLEINKGFPSKVVYDAYINPTVDLSTDSFSWGHPDLDSLREFAEEKFGWRLKKIDEILLPVMKKFNDNQMQTKIDSYFTVQPTKKENLFPSKRLQKAVKKMLPEKNDCTNEPKSKKKRSDQKKTSGQRSKQQSTSKLCTKEKQTVQFINLSEESSSDSA